MQQRHKQIWIHKFDWHQTCSLCVHISGNNSNIEFVWKYIIIWKWRRKLWTNTAFSLLMRSQIFSYTNGVASTAKTAQQSKKGSCNYNEHAPEQLIRHAPPTWELCVKLMTLDQKKVHVNRTLTKKTHNGKVFGIICAHSVRSLYEIYTTDIRQPLWRPCEETRWTEPVSKLCTHSHLVIRKHVQYSDDQWKAE
jgi:hypothetical protein